jgi:hypothetical protein
MAGDASQCCGNRSHPPTDISVQQENATPALQPHFAFRPLGGQGASRRKNEYEQHEA